MVIRAATISLNGIQAVGVDVQVQITSGLPAFQIVGLPDGTVRESRERIRCAFHAMGIELPEKRIVINLAPADLTKEGSHYDLPLAVALLAALGAIPADATQNAFFMGELALDGTLHPVPGCLVAALHATAQGAETIFTPATNAPEAAWAEEIDVIGLNTLSDLVAHLNGQQILNPTKASLPQSQCSLPVPDMADIRGQEQAKRAAEIAAAGGHNILLFGPPGSGKSMLAARLPHLLPPLTPAEALEVSMIHSVAGLLANSANTAGLITTRVFRDPHHSASAVALCGGGLKAKPGEISLAHRGVLFLDELPEFPRTVLESLRQPLEGGTITVSRANHHVSYPAKFQLVAAMNPCPCGYLDDPAQACRRAPLCAEKYQSRLSGPFLDRIDLHVHMPAVDLKKLAQTQEENKPQTKRTETTADIAKRVAAARARQQARYKTLPHVLCNADLSGKYLDQFCPLEKESEDLLQTAAERFNLSARAYHRLLKVARTVADLAGAEKIAPAHMAEALAFRPSQPSQ